MRLVLRRINYSVPRGQQTCNNAFSDLRLYPLTPRVHVQTGGFCTSQGGFGQGLQISLKLLTMPHIPDNLQAFLIVNEWITTLWLVLFVDRCICQIAILIVQVAWIVVV